MKVSELIEKLSKLDPEKEIMILDGFNAGGYPRHINVGPGLQTITKEAVKLCADCEDIGEGVEVYYLGYGSY